MSWVGRREKDQGGLMTDRETSGGTPERGGVVGYLDSRVEGMIQDFNDPRFEGRRLFSELLGTFFLVLVAAGGAVVNAQSGGQIPLAVRVTARTWSAVCGVGLVTPAFTTTWATPTNRTTAR